MQQVREGSQAAGWRTLSDVLAIIEDEGARPTSASTILNAIEAVNPAAAAIGDHRANRFISNGSYVEGVLQLGQQIADALAYAHSVGVLHLDLKPSNILLTYDATPKLLDFNLSTDVQNNDQPCGDTLPYMSPEQLDRFCRMGKHGAKVDSRSDIYSLGVILYEMLSGQLPCGEIPNGLSIKKLAGFLAQQGAAPALRSINPAIDRRVASVIDRCLEQDPTDRPQTALELASDLRRELSAPRRTWRRVRSHPKLAAAFLVACLVVFCGVAAVQLATRRDTYHVAQFKAGIAAYSGDNDRALVYFTNSIESQPTSEAYFARARVRADLGKFPDAADDVEQSLKTNRDPLRMAFLGYLWNRAGRHANAIICYESAINEGLESVAVSNNLGLSHLRQNRPERATQILCKATRPDSKLPTVLHNRALAYLARARMLSGATRVEWYCWFPMS